jgi:hypothetical protein
MGEHRVGLDPAIMVDFIEMIGIFPIGAFGRTPARAALPVVVDEDPTERALPTVFTFWSKPLGKKIRGEAIVLSRLLWRGRDRQQSRSLAGSISRRSARSADRC